MLFRRTSPVKHLREPNPLAGKKVWIPPMSSGSARTFAAAFRSIGTDAECTPPSDERTREMGARYTCGDECYPIKVTLGDFLKLLERPDFDRKNSVFFMPTSGGPCRFGQYAPYMKKVLESIGYGDVEVLSPWGDSGYSEIGELASQFVRTGWRALVSGDILLKLLLKTRPHETVPGAADAAYEACVTELCAALEVRYPSPTRQMAALKASLLRARNRFRQVPVRFDPERPLIGIVGEIFCRLNTFSNDEIVRRLEEFGGEAWMSDIGEWISYTNDEQRRTLCRRGRRLSLSMLGATIRAHFQKKDEHDLRSVFRKDFRGYEEPEDVRELLRNAEPYLPSEGASGEMVVNIGKAIYLAHKGVDGIIDISPFTCMNGIVGEAIYPRVSHDHGDIPIRNFYFDGTQFDLERDLGIYLELARSYRKRKPWPRIHPACFSDS